MTTLRTYGNLAEAGFAKSLLDAAGVPAELADEHTYALGYGPATGGLRLQVQEQDLERAERVLAEGPDAGTKAEDVSEEAFASIKRGDRVPAFPAGVFLAAAFALGAILFTTRLWNERVKNPSADEASFEYDTDGDGKNDATYIYRGETILKAHHDRNRDGKPDAWEEYDRGVLAESSSDNNRDGQPDLWYIYSKGQVEVLKTDTDFNQVADIFTYFKDGLPTTTLVKPNGASTPTRVIRYSNGLAKEADIDTNQNGVIDYRIEYDAFENETYLPPR